MQVLNGVFGGYAHSKLFANIREKESMAYYVSSSYASQFGLMFVLAGIDRKLEEKAVSLILDQLNEIKQGQTLPDVQKFALIDKEHAQYLLVGIRANITSLQDKAKVTAVAVTLAFSMVGGISSYMLNLKEKLSLIIFVICFSTCFSFSMSR